jgi:hypothetical protein
MPLAYSGENQLNLFRIPNVYPPPSKSSRWSSLAKPALAAVLASGFIGLTAGEANALMVNVGGQDYNVTTFAGSYNDNISKFATAANGGEMPWWANNTTANAFASAVGTGLGLPNFTVFGPFFAHAANPNVQTRVYSSGTSGTTSTGVVPTDIGTYAVATLVPPPVPSPLPIFGAAAAFGASRQLRKRIKRSGHSLPSTYGL